MVVDMRRATSGSANHVQNVDCLLALPVGFNLLIFAQDLETGNSVQFLEVAEIGLLDVFGGDLLLEQLVFKILEEWRFVVA